MTHFRNISGDPTDKDDWYADKEVCFCYGMHWFEFSGLEPASVEKKRAIKQYKGKGVVSCSTPLKSQVGIVSTPLPRGDVYATALVFAKNCEASRAVYISEIGRSKYSFIHVQDGLPVPGGDHVCSLEDIPRLWQDVLSDSGESQVALYGDKDTYLDDHANITVFKLLPHVDTASKSERIKPLLGLKPFIIALAVILGVLGVVGYRQYQKKIEIASRPVVAVVDPPTAEELYRKSYSGMIQGDYPRPARLTLEAYTKVISQLTVEKAGWILVYVGCGGQSCQSRWKRGIGNYKTYLDSDPAVEQSLVNITAPTGDLLSQVHSVKFESFANENVTMLLSEGFNETYKQYRLPRMSENQLDMGTWFQELQDLGIGVTTSITAPQLYGYNTQNKKPSPLKTLMVWRGSWEITTPFMVMDDLIKNMPENMTLNIFELQITQDKLTVGLKGDYYVRMQ